MHIIIGLLGLAAAAGFWIWRMRAAADAAHEILNAANDVRLAARRLGFRRQHNKHPVDSIDEATLAGAGIMAALLAQPGMATSDRRDAWIVQMQSVFGIDKAKAEELAVVGDWLVHECQTPSAAVPRLAKRLNQLAGAAALPDMERMIQAVFADGDGHLPAAVEDGLHDMRVKLRG